jgi:Tol biopolymer transport system component
MPKLLLLPLLIVAALVLPASAGATLVFQRGQLTPTIWTASDDGSGQRQLVKGSSPHISRDGRSVIYAVGLANPTLKIIPTGGGTPRTLLRRWRGGPFAWSPDGKTIATTTGPEIGGQTLVLVDVATAAQRTIASGYFNGASFSPQSDQLAYDRSASQEIYQPIDLWLVAVAGGAPRPLTTDHRSLSPVWGPTQIAYTQYTRPTGKYRKIDGPKYNLWLIAPDGSGGRALTKDRVPYLMTGYTPTSWSADGMRLLAQFNGQDTSYAIAVDAVTGAKHVIGTKAENGIAGTQLSADGSTVLGYSYGFDSDLPQEVVTVPWQNGTPTVLARKASLGSWSGA